MVRTAICQIETWVEDDARPMVTPPAIAYCEHGLKRRLATSEGGRAHKFREQNRQANKQKPPSPLKSQQPKR